MLEVLFTFFYVIEVKISHFKSSPILQQLTYPLHTPAPSGSPNSFLPSRMYTSNDCPLESGSEEWYHFTEILLLLFVTVDPLNQNWTWTLVVHWCHYILIWIFIKQTGICASAYDYVIPFSQYCNHSLYVNTWKPLSCVRSYIDIRCVLIKRETRSRTALRYLLYVFPDPQVRSRNKQYTHVHAHTHERTHALTNSHIRNVMNIVIWWI